MNENKTKKALINYCLQRYIVINSGSLTFEYRQRSDEINDIRFLLIKGERNGN